MRVPVSWLRQYADLPADLSAKRLGEALVDAGLEVERVEPVGGDVSGVVVGEVVDVEEQPQQNGKVIRWCQVDVGGGQPRGIVCGAHNFAVGDRVPVALPGSVLPGDFRITARKTYGHVSDGMICSARELGVGDDHAGILVLPGAPELGVDVVALLELRDDVLDIAVKPDRSYCLSVRGVAREAATAFGVAFRDPAEIDAPTVDAPTVDAPVGDGGHPVRVEDTSGCDRYVARVVSGIEPSARSPLWLRRRLSLAGMRPVSLVVDVTNHVMLDVGQPLHAFDRARVAGTLVVRRALPGECLTTLDGVDRELDPADLVIADDDGAVALAGVMGGARTECHAGTTDVILESAHFDPVTVARTARRHRLSSEASRRFERGVDDAVGPAAAAVAARLLVGLAGAHAKDAVTDVDHRPARPTVSLPLSYPGAVAGVDYPAEVVRRRLTDVGCELAGDDPLTVTPPTWRPDLRQPADLVEEVMRLEGYGHVPSLLPRAVAGRGLTGEQRRRRQLSRALAAAGHVEVLSYPFVGTPALDALMLPPDDERRRTVRLANPLSDDEPFLRTTLLTGLLAAVVRNVGRGARDVALYETGLVFRAAAAVGPDPAATRPGVGDRPTATVLGRLEALLPAQPRHVAAVLTGDAEPGGWWGPGRAVSWADAVASARVVADAVGVSLEVVGSSAAPFHPGRAAVLRAGGELVGYAGELHPRVVATLGLPGRTVAMELVLDRLLALDPGLVPAPRVSAFPPAHRDVALVVCYDVPAATVGDVLRSGAGPLLESLRLFDVWTGAPVETGHRSLAWALQFRAPDRTLTDEEVNAARDAAVALAADRLGARLRT